RLVVPLAIDGVDDARDVAVALEDQVGGHPGHLPRVLAERKDLEELELERRRLLDRMVLPELRRGGELEQLVQLRLDLPRLGDVVEVGAVERHVLAPPGPVSLLWQPPLRSLPPPPPRPRPPPLPRPAAP